MRSRLGSQLADHRLPLGAHVVEILLLEGLIAVACLDCEVETEDVGQLGSITVTTTRYYRYLFIYFLVI